MEKEVLELLNKWAIFSKYDSEKTCFNVFSYDYKFHNANKTISMLLNDYDESGILSIMIARKTLRDVLKDININAFEYINDFETIQKELKDEKDMWTALNAPYIKETISTYYKNLIILIQKIAKQDLIGELNIDDVEAIVEENTFKVINDLNKCRLDIYKKRGKVEKITKFSTQIYIFSSIAECLLALDNAEDGLYLTYIDVNQSPDSFFGFFIKSNGNLFSFSERIPEAYRGSHQHSRNGRWTEGKADEIFPYDFIFKYSNYDSKGYSHSYQIDNEMLSLSKLDLNASVPLLLAMVFTVGKFANKELDGEISYIDTLLSVNLPSLETEKYALTVIEKNAIIKQHKSLNLSFDVDKILNCGYDEEFLATRKVSAQNLNQLFVDMYGKGFTFDINSIIKRPDLKLLSSSCETYIPEFVGTESKQRTQIFYIIRQQLADYIREQMRKELKTYSFKYYMDWFYDAVNTNIDSLEEIIAQKYYTHLDGKKEFMHSNYSSGDLNILYDVYMEENYLDLNPFGMYFVNNRDVYKSIFFDKRTGSKCSIFFGFRPKNWKALEELFGEIPKLMKGWRREGHNCSGNTILDFTDAVEAVGTPFEYNESQNYRKEFGSIYSDFSFGIAYSKRGFAKMLKEHPKKDES